MRIACLTHVRFEGPASIADWAMDRGHDFEIVPVYEAAAHLPEDADLVVVMGGPMNIYQESEHPWLVEEKSFLRRLVTNGRTLVLGVCLGAQLVADALGATVKEGLQPEIGWYPVELTPGGRESGVLAALPDSFEPAHWHSDVFAIPASATHLVSSEACTNQAFSFDHDRVIALQFHLEATRESWTALCGGAADELEGGGEWVSSEEQMLADDVRFDVIRGHMFALLDSMVSGYQETR